MIIKIMIILKKLRLNKREYLKSTKLLRNKLITDNFYLNYIISQGLQESWRLLSRLTIRSLTIIKSKVIYLNLVTSIIRIK
jgi:vacuolar-type H+-ATPase subunit B/Vma2